VEFSFGITKACVAISFFKVFSPFVTFVYKVDSAYRCKIK